MKLADVVSGPWAITPEMLREIQGIYSRHLRGDKIDLANLEASLGRPLNSEPKSYELVDGVAILPMDGVIGKKMNLLTQISGGVSTSLFARELDKALADPQVHSVILAVDSPGGTIDGTPDLAEHIYRNRGVKPIVAHTDGQMCSAAYWIGSAADAIYISNETNTVGSIGVVTSHTDYSKAEEKAGVKTTDIYAGKYKRIASEHEPLSSAGREYIQSLIDHSYSVFVDAVAKHRGAAVDDVLERMADGRLHKGSQAIDAGLVDGVATLSELVAMLNKDRQPIIRHGAGVPQAATNHKEIAMNIETLKADHPELVEAIIAEATAGQAEALATARLEGAAVERERISAVRAQSIPGHEALVDALAFDGTSTAADAAVAIIAAEKKLRETALHDMQADAPPAAPAAEPDPAPAASPDTEEAAKAQYDKDAALQKEFGSFASYFAYVKASSAGRARIFRQ